MNRQLFSGYCDEEIIAFANDAAYRIREQFPALDSYDVAAQGMMLAVRHHAKYKSDWRLSTWISRIVLNTARNMERDRLRKCRWSGQPDESLEGLGV